MSTTQQLTSLIAETDAIAKGITALRESVNALAPSQADKLPPLFDDADKLQTSLREVVVRRRALFDVKEKQAEIADLDRLSVVHALQWSELEATQSALVTRANDVMRVDLSALQADVDQFKKTRNGLKLGRNGPAAEHVVGGVKQLLEERLARARASLGRIQDALDVLANSENQLIATTAGLLQPDTDDLTAQRILIGLKINP